MPRLLTYGWILAFLVCVASCDAQQPNDDRADGVQKLSPNATVTGHVYLDDTRAPARKATVYLEPAAALQADAPPNRSAGQDRGPVTASVETKSDGSYAFTHVAPGSYYVLAACPGYLSPFLRLSLAEGRSQYEQGSPLGPTQKDAKDRILESLSRVDVQSGVPATADLTLERGAAVSGNITYDDSGPAAGLDVQVLVRGLTHGKATWSPLPFEPFSFAHSHRTDDRGNYRISGLPPGQYVVAASLEVTDAKSFSSSSGGSSFSSNAHSSRLSFYSGSTPRESDAVAFTLQTREERTGEDILLPMNKLHTIRGNIVSALDGHVINSGQVILLHADDHSLAGHQNLTEDDPSFTFNFIFEGDYILSSPLSSDVDYEPIAATNSMGPPQFRAHPVHFYGNASQPLHVTGDMQGVTLAVPEPTSKEAQADQDMMRQEQQDQQQNQKPPTSPQ